jgi:hypothetical protein
MVVSRAPETAIRAQMVVVNDRRCPVGPMQRSWFGATQTPGACRAEEQAVHVRRSQRGGRHPRPVAGSRLSPVGLGSLSLGGVEGKPPADAQRCRPAVAGRCCLLRSHCSLATRTGRGALRSDRGHHPRNNRQRPPCRRIRSPCRPRRARDRGAARCTHHVSAPYRGRPWRKRSIDGRGGRCGPRPSCKAGYHHRTAHLLRRASESQGHRSASARY